MNLSDAYKLMQEIKILNKNDISFLENIQNLIKTDTDSVYQYLSKNLEMFNVQTSRILLSSDFKTDTFSFYDDPKIISFLILNDENLPFKSVYIKEKIIEKALDYISHKHLIPLNNIEKYKIKLTLEELDIAIKNHIFKNGYHLFMKPFLNRNYINMLTLKVEELIGKNDLRNAFVNQLVIMKFIIETNQPSLIKSNDIKNLEMLYKNYDKIKEPSGMVSDEINKMNDKIINDFCLLSYKDMSLSSI